MNVCVVLVSTAVLESDCKGPKADKRWVSLISLNTNGVQDERQRVYWCYTSHIIFKYLACKTTWSTATPAMPNIDYFVICGIFSLSSGQLSVFTEGSTEISSYKIRQADVLVTTKVYLLK